MKPVERYRAALDEIKAPDALKEKLLAIPAQYSEKAQDETQPTANVVTANASGAQGKKTIHFPTLPKHWKKQALAAAACFVVGVLATDALGWQVIPRMGSIGFDSVMYENSFDSATTTTGSTGATSVMDSALEGSISLSDTTVTLSESTTAAAADIETETRAIEEDTTTTRKIIYTTSLSLETIAYDDTLAALSAAVNATGGYLEYSEYYISSYSNERSASLTYRIPAENYTTFLAGVSEAGSITYQSESANDVTSTYLDLAARITTLTQQRDRLWELQAEAETLSDLLEIEATLTDVLYQIESYQSQLNYLVDQVDYATVSVFLDEVIEYTVTEPTAWETIRNTFTGALSDFIATMSDILLTILSLWVWIVLALIGVFVYRGVKRKKVK